MVDSIRLVLRGSRHVSLGNLLASVCSSQACPAPRVAPSTRLKHTPSQKTKGPKGPTKVPKVPKVPKPRTKTNQGPLFPKPIPIVTTVKGDHEYWRKCFAVKNEALEEIAWHMERYLEHINNELQAEVVSMLMMPASSLTNADPGALDSLLQLQQLEADVFQLEEQETQDQYDDRVAAEAKAEAEAKAAISLDMSSLEDLKEQEKRLLEEIQLLRDKLVADDSDSDGEKDHERQEDEDDDEDDGKEDEDTGTDTAEIDKVEHPKQLMTIAVKALACVNRAAQSQQTDAGNLSKLQNIAQGCVRRVHECDAKLQTLIADSNNRKRKKMNKLIEAAESALQKVKDNEKMGAELVKVNASLASAKAILKQQEATLAAINKDKKYRDMAQQLEEKVNGASTNSDLQSLPARMAAAASLVRDIEEEIDLMNDLLKE